jgi:(1->4)-alpha-D-glucan 1-alpha-D-glucosylmutase
MEQNGKYAEKQLRRAFQETAAAIPYRLPCSTYRLQFNQYFHFVDAERIIAYLHELGITDIYASPFFQARPGSMHGYDLTDYCRLNPEVGTEEEFEAYIATLHKHGMGQILDIVPNHMSIGGSTNRWWQDVLENGPSSPCAPYFDIDWKPVKEELENKVLLPILGDQYGRILENGELRLSFADGGFQVHYYEHRLPLDPKSYLRILSPGLNDLEAALGAEHEDYQELLSVLTALNHLPARTETGPESVIERRREKEIIKRRIADLYGRNPRISDLIDDGVREFNGRKGVAASFDALDSLLADQAFRLASWRVATEEINYRRFFDINDLAAVRMEYPEVFKEAHALVFAWVRAGKITGLRVDHPDGLHNPTAYFRNLQEECFIQLCLAKLAAGDQKEPAAAATFRKLYRREILKNQNTALKRPFYLVGEKILMDDEFMPAYWPIFGATGYVFMNTVNRVFIDRRRLQPLTRIYARFTGETRPFAELLHACKKLILRTSMASEINVLGHSLNRISENDRYYRDFTLNSLTQAIVEVIAHFPIYRTYVDARGVPDRDKAYIDAAINKARRASREVSPLIFNFLREVLLLRYPEIQDDEVRNQCLDFAMKFQQLTGPVMAKGMEDTAFYIYNRFVSLNEVGGNPENFGITVENFHATNLEKSAHWPSTLLATSTHDAKRSEDVRARLNVLSEITERWQEHLRRWSRKNRRWKTMLDGSPAPERNTEYLLYQSLLGAWPLEAMTEEEGVRFAERIREYMLKAAREAKTHTSWINQNSDYEQALSHFIDGVLGSRTFLEDFLPLQRFVSRCGLFNSLAQTLLKITSPGIPDFYQGTELWTFTLVDPDNRSPVDYASRAALLANLQEREKETGVLELAAELVRTMDDGRIKLYLTHKALTYRRTHQDLFKNGAYTPVQVEGPHARRVVAFLRTGVDGTILVVAPRFYAAFEPTPDQAPLGNIWLKTALILPESQSDSSYRNIFTGEVVHSTPGGDYSILRLADVLAQFPVALLARI